MPVGMACGFSCRLAPQQPLAAQHASHAAQQPAAHASHAAQASHAAAQQPAAMPDTASGFVDDEIGAGMAAGFSKRLDAARPHGAAATPITIATPAPITAGSIVLDNRLRLIELMVVETSQVNVVACPHNNVSIDTIENQEHYIPCHRRFGRHDIQRASPRTSDISFTLA
jgi:hypothetical protein